MSQEFVTPVIIACLLLGVPSALCGLGMTASKTLSRCWLGWALMLAGSGILCIPFIIVFQAIKL